MKHSGQTVLWELWAALCLCTALVLPPGSPWLHEPALLYPGLMLAAVVPAAWAVWWMALPPQPLPPEQLLEPVQRQSLAALCGTDVYKRQAPGSAKGRRSFSRVWTSSRLLKS